MEILLIYLHSKHLWSYCRVWNMKEVHIVQSSNQTFQYQQKLIIFQKRQIILIYRKFANYWRVIKKFFFVAITLEKLLPKIYTKMQTLPEEVFCWDWEYISINTKQLVRNIFYLARAWAKDKLIPCHVIPQNTVCFVTYYIIYFLKMQCF